MACFQAGRGVTALEVNYRRDIELLQTARSKKHFALSFSITTVYPGGRGSVKRPVSVGKLFYLIIRST